MSRSRTVIRVATWAGLWLPGLVWATNTQLGQIVPLLDCTTQVRWSALVSAIFTVLALLAALVSWRFARSAPLGFGSPRTIRFDAAVSAVSALVFAFALMLQTIASLMVSGCER
jgi:hypothetical protein